MCLDIPNKIMATLGKTISKDWRDVNLGNVCIFERGVEPGAEAYNTEGIGERFLRVADVTESRDNPIYVDISTTKKIKRSDIVLTLDGTIGAVKMGLEGIFSTGVRKVYFKDKGNSNHFLYYLLQSSEIQRKMELYASGSTIKHASGVISQLHTRIPGSIKEQNYIAEILSAVDGSIEKTELLVKKYKVIKSGLIADLFRYGIDKAGRIRNEKTHKFKNSIIGMVPIEWRVCKFGDYLDEGIGYVQTGPFGSQLHSYEYILEGVPVVMPQDICDGKIVLTNIAQITEQKSKELSRHSLKINDVILSRRGDLNRAVSISSHQEGWICGTGCLLLRIKPGKIDGNWFAALYLSPLVQRQLEAIAVGSTMKNINTEVVRDILIAIPPIDEQRKIRNHLLNLDNLISSEEAVKQKLIKQKHGLMEDLLNGIVSAS
jgi:type I restriction enzyme S subunit